jgi:hypothetical protein
MILMSLFLLFSDSHLCLSLPSVTFSSFLFVVGLMSAGGGVGVVLWMAWSSLLKRNQTKKPVQNSSILPGTILVSSGGRMAFPPEPVGRQTGELFLSGFDRQQVDRWISSEWDIEPRKNTDALEALHMRQRLRIVRSYYADDILNVDLSDIFARKGRRGE